MGHFCILRKEGGADEADNEEYVGNVRLCSCVYFGGKSNRRKNPRVGQVHRKDLRGENYYGKKKKKMHSQAAGSTPQG